MAMSYRTLRVRAATIVIAGSCAAMAFGQQYSTTNAREVRPGPGVINPDPTGARDGPTVAHPVPPLDQIPPIPMPVFQGAALDGAVNNGFIYHDTRTGQDRTIPPEVWAALTEGQTGGSLPPETPITGEGFRPRGLGTMSAISTRNTFPWSANCKVIERFNNGAGGASWFVCSGTMIDPATCLVAGHCVYNRGNGIPNGWATDVYIVPGWDGNGNIVPPNSVGSNTSLQNFGYAHSTGLGAGTAWVNSGSRDQDWGVVSLDRAVGGLTGWFGTAWGYSCATIQSRTYYNTSYPAENPCGIAGLHNGQTMYFWAGTIDSCPSNQLELVTTPGCFTAVWGGMSGSSMYYLDANTRYAHAVCSTSNRSTAGDYCRLDQGAFNYINSSFIPGARGAAFDAQALNCQIAPTSVQAGATTATQNFLMYNGSNGAANATWTFRVYLSSNDFISTSDTLLSTQTVPWNSPALSALRVNMAPVTIPAGTPPGTYWIGVILDPGTDGNSGNNATQSWDAARITVTPAAPTNDLCPNATFATEGSYSGYTATANLDGSSNCGTGGTGQGKDVWYRYQASAAGTVNINTCGSSYDTVLSLHSSCPGTTANQLACNDDNGSGNGACGGGLQSGLNFTTAAFATYYIRIAGYSGASGSYILNIVPIAPPNDDCASAPTITPGTYTGSTGFANTDGAATCGYSQSAPDVWYAITPATDGLARLDTCSSSYDTVLSVYTGCPGNLDNEIACNDDAPVFTACTSTLQSVVNVPVSAGATYYIRVSGFNGRNGTYTLHYNLGAFANDTCDNPTPVTFGTYTFDNTGATTDGPTEANCAFCCGDLQVNQDIWYSIVAPCERTITIDTFGSSFDTKLAVYASCPFGADSAIVCNDDFVGTQSQVTLAPVAGTLYLIRVGSYVTNVGAGVLNIRTCLPDFDCNGLVNVQDIFAFLSAWFASDPRSDYNLSGVSDVQDIFDFLSSWFAGC